MGCLRQIVVEPVQPVVDRPEGESNSSKSGDREMKLASDGIINRKVMWA
ncbi:hypothetical protein QUB68_08185 [Microcoleus sp. A006_D1]